MKEFGFAAPSTRKACSMILDWIRKGGSQSGQRIAILKDGQSWVGKRVKEKDGDMTGTVLFVLPKTPESILNSGRHEDASHAFSHPLDAKVERDSDKKRVIASVGRLERIV